MYDVLTAGLIPYILHLHPTRGPCPVGAFLHVGTVFPTCRISTEKPKRDEAKKMRNKTKETKNERGKRGENASSLHRGYEGYRRRRFALLGAMVLDPSRALDLRLWHVP